MAEKLQNPIGRALAANTLGLAWHGQSEYPRAIEYFHRAAALCEQVGHADVVLEILENLTESYAANAQPGPAADTCERALTLATELEHPSVSALQSRLDTLKPADNGSAQPREVNAASGFVRPVKG